MRVGRLTIDNALARSVRHFTARGPVTAGVSGGRTSALMHVLTLAMRGTDDYFPVFANTGKEHAGTYTFLERLAETTNVPIPWIEFRPPAPGAPLKDAAVVEVDAQTADRTGRPLEDVLAATAAFRATKGEGAMPFSRLNRLCTVYTKIRAQRQWIRGKLGDEDYVSFIGLRADEPTRVHGLLHNDRSGVDFACPLATAGITKQMVLDFWKAQPFDLEIPEYLGNCTKCFLKDEADLAQSMYEEPEDVAWWLDIQARYGNFRFNDRIGYAQIAAEAPTRLEVIRPALAAGHEPERPEGFDTHRWKLLVRQEQRRLREGTQSFSCACERVQVEGQLDA